ncbi:MAG: hypothetical protein HON65_12420 [Rhodospirillales bacterium]|jgi:hypothetical protein|nr:hypothetical protein [Rhodospirillales bacterium]
MSKIQFSVYEFMSIVGHMDEGLKGQKAAPGSVYHEWIDQWNDLDKKSEALGPMERADLLFDGKVTINAITSDHLKEVISVVDAIYKMNEQMVEDEDPDADEEDVSMWRNRLRELNGVLASFGA